MNIKNPYDCEHENNEIRRRIVGGGAEQYIRQCLDCGKTVGTAVKKAVVFEKYPNGVDDYDDALVRLKEHQYDMYMEQQQQERRREFFDWYSEYLKSTEWRNRRALVLKRAGNVCEGCLSADATEVHHLTYDHVGDELLFELVALCGPCHAKAHEGKK